MQSLQIMHEWEGVLTYEQIVVFELLHCTLPYQLSNAIKIFIVGSSSKQFNETYLPSISTIFSINKRSIEIVSSIYFLTFPWCDRRRLHTLGLNINKIFFNLVCGNYDNFCLKPHFKKRLQTTEDTHHGTQSKGG